MRPILLLILLAASVLFPIAAAAECLPSAAAVRAIHGQQAWSTYKTVNGIKCYSLGERHGRSDVHRSVADNRSARARAVRLAREVKEAELRSLFPERPPVMTPEAAYVEGIKMLKAYFVQKAKMAEAGR